MTEILKTDIGRCTCQHQYTVQNHLAILDFFDGHLCENGMVGSVGGVLYANPYWSFIDWSRQWSATVGVPSACQKGSHALTMESLLYLYGLQKAAEQGNEVLIRGANESVWNPRWEGRFLPGQKPIKICKGRKIYE